MRAYVKVVAPYLLFLFVVLLISGCGLGNKDKVADIDPPQNIEYVDSESELEDSGLTEDDSEEGNQETGQETESTEMIKRQIFLLDSNGMVSPQLVDIPVPESKEVAKQALEYLVKDGPVTNHLPNGFQAVLPAGTEVLGVNIKEGVATADFSEEFKEYEASDEQKILQSITWTLTQFESIDRVKIRINGHEQEVMPVNGTPISGGVSRQDGINIDAEGVTDMTNSFGVTVYFLAQSGDHTYYVPVTKRINGKESDTVTAVINGLIEGPSLQSGLFSDFSTELELLESLVDEDGLVTLNFNEALLNQQHIISNDVLNSLVLSLTENEDVSGIAIQVNGEANVLTESGDQLAQPVTREMMTETLEF